MSQVGQVLEDYTRWLDNEGLLHRFPPALEFPDGSVEKFLKDYDHGEWLPNTPDPTPSSQHYKDFLEWLMRQGILLPLGPTLHLAIVSAFMGDQPPPREEMEKIDRSAEHC